MITMQDTCQLATTVSDGYGDKTVELLTEIDCLFLQSTTSSHSSNTDVIEADAHVYLDPENDAILEKAYRLEGLYLIINPFGGDNNKSWYRITRVVVGQRKLLDNDVDNVHCFLRKVAAQEILNVS